MKFNTKALSLSAIADIVAVTVLTISAELIPSLKTLLTNLLLSFMLGGSCALAENFPVKPDPHVTQGDFCNPRDPDFVDFRYEEKIAYCARNVSRYTKAEIYDLYDVPERCRREYTVDHYIPLFVGGSNHQVNLWPEHKSVKATRQNLEMNVYTELKNGRLTQQEAVEIITNAKLNPPEVAPSHCHRFQRQNR